jgi:hypothetical protein
MKPPSRQELDLIARAVASGRRGFGKRLDRLANETAALMTNRLEALGVRGATRKTPREGPRSRALLDPRSFEVLLRRVEKHLGQRALVEVAVGASPPR